MKQKILLSLFLLLAVSTTWADVEINDTNFPDANFRNWLLVQDYGKDSILTQKEIAKVKEIEVDSLGIKSLQGIEYFTKLTILSCSNNQLSELDVSKNTKLTSLSCFRNQLTELDVTKNKKLLRLDCHNNRICGSSMSVLVTSLPDTYKKNFIERFSEDVNKDSNSSFLDKLTAFFLAAIFRKRKPIREMKVLGNENERNQVSPIQVYATRAKGWILYSYNGSTWDKLSSGDFKKQEGAEVYEAVYSKNTYPEEFYPKLAKELKINEENFPDENFRNYLLKLPYCSDSLLTNMSRVVSVYKKNIQSMKGVEFFMALTSLECPANQLTVLDVSQNTALTELQCYSNKLTELDMSKNTALICLGCGMNQLTELNVSGCTALTKLLCANNQLTELDLSRNTELTMLYCYNNKLTELDVSKKTKLCDLYCYSNQLTSLDVSGCIALETLYCYQNRIKGAAMDALVESLPSVNKGYLKVIYNTNEQNEMTTTQVAAAKAKGWIPQYYDRYKWREYTGSE